MSGLALLLVSGNLYLIKIALNKIILLKCVCGSLRVYPWIIAHVFHIIYSSGGMREVEQLSFCLRFVLECHRHLFVRGFGLLRCQAKLIDKCDVQKFFPMILDVSFIQDVGTICFFHPFYFLSQKVQSR